MVATAGIGRLLINMPDDLEISGRFYWQLREMLGDNFVLLRLEDSASETFNSSVLDTMLKLHAMRYHLENFEKLETNYLVAIESVPDGIHHTHRMLFEFEAFLFQLKSSLDVAVKILGTLFPGRFKVTTFKEKGDAICKGLEQLKRDKSTKTEVADALISVIRGDQESWLGQAINLRDTISHYKALADFNYQAVNLGGTRTIKNPRIAGMPPRDYLRLTYQNCIEFLQDFICISVVLHLPPQFVLAKGSPHIGPPIDQFIKFGVGMSK